MSEIITVGLDLAKNVFVVHGADASGLGVLRMKLRRDQVLAFFSHLPPCLVAMEACGGAHVWGREICKLGHEVRLIPPAYVKPFVKRQKNDAADAEAICEAAMRPTMRFVPVKSEETQGAAMVFRIRELLIRQRTQAINALRGHLGEFGQIVPQGAANAARLIAIVEDPDSGLPADAIATLKVLVKALTRLETEIGELDAEIARRAKDNDVARRLMTVPGIGPLIATAIAVLAPPPETFRKARDFAAWPGLTPRQHSTGGKQRLGATTKMGGRSLRRLLIIGANSVIIKRHVHAAARPGTWLGGMMTRKPPMLVRVALANKTARIVWALMARGGVYGRDRHDPSALAHLQVGRIQPDVGPLAGQRAVQELADALVDVLAQLRDRALRDAVQPHRLHQLVDAAGRDATNPRLLYDGNQRLLRGLAGLEEAREVAALPELRHPQVQPAQTGIESALSIPVAPGRAIAAAFMPTSADDAFHIGLHDQLQHGFGNAAQKVALIVLGQKLGQVHHSAFHSDRWRDMPHSWSSGSP